MPAFALIKLDTLTSHGNSPRYGKMNSEELRQDNLLERAAPNVSLLFKVIFQQLVLTRKLILLAARACTSCHVIRSDQLNKLSFMTLSDQLRSRIHHLCFFFSDHSNNLVNSGMLSIELKSGGDYCQL